MSGLPRTTARRFADVVFMVGVAVAFGLAANGLFRKITWYLAIDQYGYLTFADDLAAGRIFHHWAPMDALWYFLPFPRVDVLSQTYVFAGDRMYCRYSPGFPILLAGWVRLFGPDAAHYLDPLAFLVLLAVYLELARRLLAALPGARWLGLAGVLLLLLLPSYLHLWAITVLRDIPAQVVAFSTMLVALPREHALTRRRAAVIGLLAGYLVCIRIDAVLYGLPIGTLLLLQRRQNGALALGAACALLGVMPLLAYNHLSTGNPLRPTQGMELDGFFGAVAPPSTGSAARALAARSKDASPRTVPSIAPAATDDGVIVASAPPAPRRRRSPGPKAPPPIQGGGLRLQNLTRTLPGNAAYVREAMGPVLLTLAAVGIFMGVVGTRVRRLVVLAVPYSAAALMVFSFWGRADPRYIAGLLLFGPLLTLAGYAELARLHTIGGSDDPTGSPALGTGWTAPHRARAVAGVAVALLLGVVWRHALLGAWTDAAGAWTAGGWQGGTALPVVGGVAGALALLVAVTAGLRAGGSWPRWPAPALALLLLVIAVVRVIPSWNRPPVPFQGPRGKVDVEAARRTIEAVIEPGAVVMTTTEVGRPAENIDHYTHAHAVYITDLQRWGFPVPLAAARFLLSGHAVYLLVPSGSPKAARALEGLRNFRHGVERVAHVDAADAARYFVASRFGPTDLDLYRITMSEAVMQNLHLPEGTPGVR